MGDAGGSDTAGLDDIRMQIGNRCSCECCHATDRACKFDVRSQAETTAQCTALIAPYGGLQAARRWSVEGCIPTQSVGTISSGAMRCAYCALRWVADDAPLE